MGLLHDKPSCRNPFYSVQEEIANSVTHGAGAGLGLAICRGLVEAHRGTITIGESATGGGCVTIRLPLGSPSIEV